MRAQCWLLLGALGILTGTLAGAQAPASAATQDEAAGVGRDVYLRECASCHGEAGTGYGPSARWLRQQPIDLTAITSRTRPFDRQSVRAGITGHIRADPPHETGEMPRWRGRLETAVPIDGGTVTELDALLTYLETIQRQPYGQELESRSAALARAGGPLFATHCAACHGANGRGFPPAGYTVGIAPPDLTTIASRSGGQIDFRTLYEAIARRDHTSGEMPSWDRALREAGWPAVIAAKNLEALARYVESIQRR
jgi:mono/diheme cytochrome c family protein